LGRRGRDLDVRRGSRLKKRSQQKRKREYRNKERKKESGGVDPSKIFNQLAGSSQKRVAEKIDCVKAIGIDQGIERERKLAGGGSLGA